MRFILIGAARIVAPDGRYLLRVTNTSRGRVMLPFGGTLEATIRTKRYLVREFGATGFLHNDLRLDFYLADALRTGEIIDWFLKGKGRETSPLRLLKEQLAAIGLSQAEFEHTSIQLRRVIIIPQDGLRWTPHGEVPIKQLVEVHDATSRGTVLARLIDLANRRPDSLYLASAEEIRNGYVEGNPRTRIDTAASALLPRA